MTTLIAIGGALTGILAVKSRHPAPVVASFVIHLALGGAVWVYLGFAVPDASLYSKAATNYVDYWTHATHNKPEFPISKEGWVVVLAAIYWTFGAVPLLGVVLNALFSAATVTLVMDATAEAGRREHARGAGWLMLLPSFLLWSSLLLREALVWMLIALALLAGVRLAKNAGGAAWLVVALVGLLWVRGTLTFVIGIGVAIPVVIVRRKMPVGLASLLGLIVVFAAPIATQAIGVFKPISLQSINASRTELAAAGSGFGVESYGSPVDVLTALPRTFPRVLVGPYPNQLSNLPAVAAIDWIVWIGILSLSLLGCRGLGRACLINILPALTLLIIIGATSGNYGTMIRLRPMVAIFLIPLVVRGLSLARTRLKRGRPANSVSYMCQPLSNST